MSNKERSIDFPKEIEEDEALEEILIKAFMDWRSRSKMEASSYLGCLNPHD